MDLPLSDVLRLSRISALVALRDESALRKELRKTIRSGVAIAVVREAILQCYLFAGYAAVINAFIALNEIAPANREFLRERQGSLKKWKARGTKLCQKIYSSQYEKLFHNMKRLHPDLAEWMIWEGYGKVLARPFLSPRVRELLIVGMTAVLNVERQFHSHIKGAINVGATSSEVKAVLREVKPLMNVKSWKRFSDLANRL